VMVKGTGLEMVWVQVAALVALGVGSSAVAMVSLRGRLD
jgi:hypothetical protein